MFSPFAFVFGSSSPLSSSSSSHIKTPFTPRYSSPLANPASSPIEAAKARRRGQFKAGPSRIRPPAEVNLSSPETKSRMFIKEKFKARCEAKMRKTQVMAAKKSPWMSSSSDGFDDEDFGMDDDENPEDDLDDELFRRVMMRETRRRDHKFNVSYEQEVGSEFDPNYHDPTELEESFHEEVEDIPYDPEEELQAYIDEYAGQLDSEGDFDMGQVKSTTTFRPAPTPDDLSTPRRMQRIASAFPFPSS